MTFEDKLREFFKKHDPGRLRFARKIANKYQPKAKDVLAELAKIYAGGGPGTYAAKMEAKRNAAFQNFPTNFDEISEGADDEIEDDTVVTEVEKSSNGDTGMIDDLDD